MTEILPQPVLIAPGSSDDLDKVVEVMKSAFEERFGEGWTRSQCAGILPMPGVRLMLARHAEGHVVGFSLDRCVADDAELLLLAVAPSHRRRGVGRTLLQAFLDRCRNGAIRNVHLEVRDGNSAMAMYRDAGFSTVGRRTAYYVGRSGEKFDALTLNKAL